MSLEHTRSHQLDETFFLPPWFTENVIFYFKSKCLSHVKKCIMCNFINVSIARTWTVYTHAHSGIWLYYGFSVNNIRIFCTLTRSGLEWRRLKSGFKKPAHQILNETNSFQIPSQNSRASLVCLLPVLFLFLEYRRSLV